MITGVAADHPELDEQEMIMACSDCHREVTPELTEEWWNSAHGIGNVKCYQCHGTYENMMVIPAQSNCEICHMDKASDPVKGLAWRKSHPAHSFQGGVR